MVELLLITPEAQVESVSDALMDELDALSVSVEDADAGTDAEHALFGEPGMPAPQGGWQRSVVKALFASEDAAREAAELLLAQEWATGIEQRSIQDGSMLPLVNLVFVLDLTNINSIAKQIGEGANGEKPSTDGPAGVELANTGRGPLFPKLVYQLH